MFEAKQDFETSGIENEVEGFGLEEINTDIDPSKFTSQKTETEERGLKQKVAEKLGV